MKKISLVIPVYNEEKILENSIKKLYDHMSKNIKKDWKIIIANNASTDKTKEIAGKLVKKYSQVEAMHLLFKGRGNALKCAWKKYKSDVYAYCDVDLATDISYLKELFDNVFCGNNIVIGSRYLKEAKSNRTINRLILSKGYNYLIRLFFRTRISDFQCGFKAVDDKIIKEIIPRVKNKKWFFDTEMLLLAEQSGKYNIKEIPVSWRENKDTKVRIFEAIYEHIKGLVLLKKRLNEN